MIDLRGAVRHGFSYLAHRGLRGGWRHAADLVRRGTFTARLRALFGLSEKVWHAGPPHPFPFDARLRRARNAAGSYDAFRTRQVGRSGNCRARVVFVTQDSGIGGGHRVIYRYLATLARNAYRVELWTLQGPPDWYRLDPAITLRTFAGYDDLIAALRPLDAVKVATWWATALPVWLSALDRGLPVYLVQDIETSYYRGEPAMAERVLASYRPEFTYLTTTEALRDTLAERMDLKAFAVGLGYDDDAFRPDPRLAPTAPTLLVAARSEPLKNFAYAKAILRRLHGDLRGACRIVAFGPDAGLVSDLPAVQFVAAPSDRELAALYASSTLFLSTSTHEGFGLPPIEAMACGCPVVTTDALGTRAYAVAGRNCVMIPHGDAREAAARIRRLLTDPALREALSEAGLETAARYGWSRADRRLLAAFADIAAAATYGRPVADTAEESEASRSPDQ